MNITWITFHPIVETGNGYFSPMSSLRHRLIIPMGPLEALGHRIQILNVEPDDTLETVMPRVAGEVVVFAKVMFQRGEVFRKLARLVADMARTARDRGQRVIVDICDDLFGLPVYGEFLKGLVGSADLVVTSSAALSEVVGAYCARPTRVAEDPFEGARGRPRFAPPRARARGLLARLAQDAFRSRFRSVRLVWHGHGSNLPAVVDFMPDLARLARRHPLELNLVAAVETNAATVCERYNESYAPLCTARFTPWSLEATWRALEECDFMIIPTSLGDATKLVKSNNRVVQALWAGRFVVAHPIESYRALGAYSWIGIDLVEGIEWALANPREVLRRIAAGQKHVEAHYAPQAIARQWDAALRAVQGRPDGTIPGT